MPTPLRESSRVAHKPTYEQDMVLEDFLSGATVVASALAGTGKTSTCVMCAKATHRPGAYWAFNKAIAMEAADKMPPRVRARTASSFAYQALINDLPWIQHRLHQRVSITTMASKLHTPRFGMSLGGKKIGGARLAGLAGEMVLNYCQSDDKEITLDHVPFVRGLEAQFNKDTGELIVPSSLPDLAEILLPFAQLYWKDVQTEKGRLRFTFDHYMKIWALGEVVTPNIAGEYIVVDEAQDLNAVEIGILRRMDKQLLVVGDANQQIYEFRGSKNAMSEFGLPVEQHLPLTMSFRFGEDIAYAANMFLAELRAPQFIEGNPDKTSRLVENMHAPDAILSRTNAGALEMLIEAIESGIENIAVTGRIKALEGFIEAAHTMQLGQITTHPDLAAFSKWEAVQEYVKQTQDGDYAMQVAMIDRFGCERLLKALAGTVPLSDADLAISTAHSAKGLEWNKVKIANDFNLETDPVRGGPKRADFRLAYVAVTRAIEDLHPGGLRPWLYEA